VARSFSWLPWLFPSFPWLLVILRDPLDSYELEEYSSLEEYSREENEVGGEGGGLEPPKRVDWMDSKISGLDID